jgi:hypothetical protein
VEIGITGRSHPVAVFLFPRDLLLRWLNGLLLLVLQGMDALVGNIMLQHFRHFLAVISEELRIVRSTRDGDVGHAVVEQVFRIPKSPYIRSRAKFQNDGSPGKVRYEM